MSGAAVKELCSDFSEFVKDFGRSMASLLQQGAMQPFMSKLSRAGNIRAFSPIPARDLLEKKGPDGTRAAWQQGSVNCLGIDNERDSGSGGFGMSCDVQGTSSFRKNTRNRFGWFLLRATYGAFRGRGHLGDLLRVTVFRQETQT